MIIMVNYLLTHKIPRNGIKSIAKQCLTNVCSLLRQVCSFHGARNNMLICSTRPQSRVSLANAGGCLLIVIGAIQPQSALAGPSSWSQSSSSWNSAVTAVPQSPPARRNPPPGSSFNAPTTSTFDTPAPPNPASQRQSIPIPRNSSELVRLRALIASAEAGPADYDAVQHQARIAPPKRPTQMTISEVYAWIGATPGQHHAIGRYQIIPATLTGLVRNTGISTNTRFTPQIQDMLANVLIAEAGYHRFGPIGRFVRRITLRKNFRRT